MAAAASRTRTSSSRVISLSVKSPIVGFAAAPARTAEDEAAFAAAQADARRQAAAAQAEREARLAASKAAPAAEETEA